MQQAAEYRKAGYRIFKIKCGLELEHDVEVVHRIRETLGADVTLTVDPNQGYDLPAFESFFDRTRRVGLDFIEQPLPVSETELLRSLPVAYRDQLALDESVQSARDALRLSCDPQPARILNIKLMKSGGIYEALRIATIAEAANLTLMWGCMLESRVGLSAALHAAMASPNTKYLDLDGDFHLAEDIATHGYINDHGELSINGAPGLGLRMHPLSASPT